MLFQVLPRFPEHKEIFIATIKDVAKVSGVSIATVSHVINKTRYVSPAVTKNVLDAIEATGYRPNIIARSLRTRESRMLGVVFSTNLNPFYAEVLQGIEDTATKAGYSPVVLYSNNNPELEAAAVERLIEKGADALLINSIAPDQMLQALILRAGVPVLVFNRHLENIPADFFHCDDFEGARLGTEYLIKTGLASVACVTQEAEASHSYSRRVDGFLQAHQDACINPDSSLIIKADFQIESGFKIMNDLIQRRNRPRSLFCFSDHLAIGALSAAYRAGIRVPQDMAILGYDNIPLGQFMNPPLSSIDQEKFALGEKAVNRILERLKNPELPPAHVITKPSFIKRDSA